MICYTRRISWLRAASPGTARIGHPCDVRVSPNASAGGGTAPEPPAPVPSSAGQGRAVPRRPAPFGAAARHSGDPPGTF